MSRGFLALEGTANSIRAGFDILEGDEPDGQSRLTLKNAHEIGVPHRCERVILHAAFVQRHAVDEEMALIDRAPVRGKGRAGDREVAAREREKRVGHRADIAGIGRVECRAVFEEEIPCAGTLQRARGNRTEAARTLGISVRCLQYKLKTYARNAAGDGPGSGPEASVSMGLSNDG